MKKFLFILYLLCSISSFSQSPSEDLEQINKLLIDASASFLEFPYEHDNTIKVFNRIKKLNEIYKKLQAEKSSVLAQIDHDKVREFYNQVDKMQAIADTFEELLRNIAGFISSGIEGPTMEIILDPLLEKAGWEKRVLNITCSDAYFVEYIFQDFKMMFIKSTRPANDYRNCIYNNIEVSFTYAGQYGGGGTYTVGGNKYRMIQFKDDQHTIYHRIVKATSIRNK